MKPPTGSHARPYGQRSPARAALRLASTLAAVALIASGCSEIWNASDLAVWVKERAVEQGCQRETIELDTWYTPTAAGNVWRGTCRDAAGATRSFGIDIDPVWKPSQPVISETGKAVAPQ